MRTFLTYLMICLLLACPVLCRAAADGCCADHEETSETPDEHHAPTSTGDAKSCICSGAIKATDNRMHGPGPESPSPAPDTLLSDCILPHLCPLTLHVAQSGSPHEGNGWQGSRRVHALFQHFRC